MKKKSAREYERLEDQVSMAVRVRVHEVEWYDAGDARDYAKQHFAKHEHLALIDRDAFCFRVEIEKTKDGMYLTRSYWRYFASLD